MGYGIEYCRLEARKLSAMNVLVKPWVMGTGGILKIPNHKDQVLEALERNSTEREIHSYLKGHPLLIRNAFNTWAWNKVITESEFELGNSYRVDFLVLSADSGQWHANFVELKSHREAPFTKDGIPSKALNVALAQLQDRILWIEGNQPTFRQSLAGLFETHKVAAQCSHSDLHTRAATEIVDMRTHISFQYFVMIGRRNMISTEYSKRRHINSQVKVATYDRLIDVAKKLDEVELERLKYKL